MSEVIGSSKGNIGKDGRPDPVKTKTEIMLIAFSIGLYDYIAALAEEKGVTPVTALTHFKEEIRGRSDLLLNLYQLGEQSTRIHQKTEMEREIAEAVEGWAKPEK